MPRKLCPKTTSDAEASLIAPLLQSWRGVSNPDLVGAYILATLSVRNPCRYLSSEISPFVVTTEEENCLYPSSRPLREFSGLLSLLDTNYLRKKLKVDPEDIPVAVIFNR